VVIHTFYQNYLAMRILNFVNVTDGKPIAVRSQSISGMSAVNSLVAFYEKATKGSMEEKEGCYSFMLSRTQFFFF
jgi:hypothetical protein